MKNAAMPYAGRVSGGDKAAGVNRGAPPRKTLRKSTSHGRLREVRSLTVPGLLLASVFVLACTETPVSPDASLSDSPQFAVGDGVFQHVSVGSNDLCPALGLPPGCDANFSLVANKWTDGTVRGQWQDGFGKDANGQQLGGVHVAIDCLEVIDVHVGIYTFPVAWVSGIVTKSSNPAFNVGDGAITLAVERGTSSNDLFQDLASLTFPLSSFPAGTTCRDMPGLPVFLNVAFTGQVDIWRK